MRAPWQGQGSGLLARGARKGGGSWSHGTDEKGGEDEDHRSAIRAREGSLALRSAARRRAARPAPGHLPGVPGAGPGKMAEGDAPDYRVEATYLYVDTDAGVSGFYGPIQAIWYRSSRAWDRPFSASILTR